MEPDLHTPHDNKSSYWSGIRWLKFARRLRGVSTPHTPTLPRLISSPLFSFSWCSFFFADSARGILLLCNWRPIFSMIKEEKAATQWDDPTAILYGAGILLPAQNVSRRLRSRMVEVSRWCRVFCRRDTILSSNRFSFLCLPSPLLLAISL